MRCMFGRRTSLWAYFLPTLVLSGAVAGLLQAADPAASPPVAQADPGGPGRTGNRIAVGRSTRSNRRALAAGPADALQRPRDCADDALHGRARG